MKPTKNRVFCNNCGRIKMLFPSEEKANNFIRFNADSIAESSRNVPVRSYFCAACGGWHVTHKEESDAYARTDEKAEKVFRLITFADSLKRDFNKKDWMKWKEALQQHGQTMAELQDMPEYRLSLIEVKRQLNHYGQLVVSAEKNIQKNNNRLFDKINAERKVLCDDIREKMKDLNVKDCTASAERLGELMQMPVFERTEKRIIQECKDMTSCLLAGEKRKKLESIINTLQYLNGRLDYIPTEDLDDMVGTLTEDFLFVTNGLKDKKFLHTLQHRVTKCQNYLQVRTGKATANEGVDKALQMLDTLYGNVRRNLIDAVTFLQKGENGMAVECITLADNRLKAIPMSTRKVEMLKYLTAVAEQAVLNAV